MEKGLIDMEFKKELLESERFGNIAVRTTYQNAIEKAERNFDQFVLMAEALLQAADRSHCKKSSEMTGTYLFLYHCLCDYAKEYLSKEDYHQFCEHQNKYCYYLYL